MRALRLALYCCALGAFMLSACGSEERPIRAGASEQAVPAPELIQKPGRYLIRGGADELHIFEAPANALAYRIGEPTDGDSISGGLISDAKKPWFFHSAGDGSLWVYDSAIGVVQWTYGESGGWESTELEDDAVELGASMPDPFFDRLPQDLKDHWETVR